MTFDLTLFAILAFAACDRVYRGAADTHERSDAAVRKRSHGQQTFGLQIPAHVDHGFPSW
jgi:hypothetical protein